MTTTAEVRGEPPAANWVSAHLFHHGDLDALITRVVRPVVGELVAAGAVRRHFYLRYWEGGRHVRLRLLPEDPGEAGPIRDLVRARAAEYFAAHPSTEHVDEAAYRAFAAAAAKGERLTRYDDRLRPADTVEFIGYRPEHSAYGDAECVAAAERHFTESSALALDVLGSGAPMDVRAAIGLATLTLALAACEPDLAAAATRFAAAKGKPRTSAERGPGRAAVLAQTRSLWEGGPGEGLLAAWAQSLRTLRAALDPLCAQGRCAPSDPGSPHASLAEALPPGRRTVPLILLRCTHLFHNRLGLHASAESHVSSLVARALTDLARAD
jgi:hypothetical protein